MRWIVALLIVVLLVMVACSVSAQVRATWKPPTTGSPVAEYVLEVYKRDQPYLSVVTPDTFYTFSDALATWELYAPYTARVAGRDSIGRQGPWSEMSDPYILDPGVPAAPLGVIMELAN